MFSRDFHQVLRDFRRKGSVQRDYIHFKMKSSEEEEGLVENQPELRPVELSLAVALLVECIDKVSMFRVRHPNINGRFDMRYLKDRADEPYYAPYKPLTMKPLELWSWKLAWEMACLQRVLVIAKDELWHNGTNMAMRAFNEHEKNLVAEVEQYQNFVKDINYKDRRKTHIADQRNQRFTLPLQQITSKLQMLEQEYHEVERRIKIAKDYCKQFEENRVAQNKYAIEFEENKHINTINTFNDDIVKEDIAHTKIMQFLTDAIKMLESKTEYWQEQYKEDIDLRNNEIKIVLNDQKNQTAEKQKLFEDYIRRGKEIEIYLVEREERIKEEKHQEYLNKNAAKIQAWWRGCMVRWNLGQFCQDNLKKKKKKPKKK